MRKKLFTILLATAVTLPLSAMAGGDQGPAAMDLKARFKVEGKKKAVIFPHRQHQEKLTCGQCHANPQGGGNLIVTITNMKGTKNDFHKKLCWPCHKEMKVKKGRSCKTCHK